MARLSHNFFSIIKFVKGIKPGFPFLFVKQLSQGNGTLWKYATGWCPCCKLILPLFVRQLLSFAFLSVNSDQSIELYSRQCQLDQLIANSCTDLINTRLGHSNTAEHQSFVCVSFTLMMCARDITVLCIYSILLSFNVFKCPFQ